MMREDWLERRLREVPEVLADRVRDLAGSAPRTPEGLSNAALAGFELVARGCETRAGALDLLAADALLMYAFEVAVDPGMGGSIDGACELAGRLGPGGVLGRRAVAIAAGNGSDGEDER